MMHRFELDGAITRDQIPDVRRFVERMHTKLLGDGDLVSRIAMAAHELFENAVKFSIDGSAKLSVSITETSVCIITTNRAAGGNLEELRDRAKALREAHDMMRFYVELMRKGDPKVRGGLGLGRVAAEAEMTLQLDVTGDLVVIRAELEHA